MLKKTICAAAAMLVAQAANAEGYSQPRILAEGFYSNMRATIGGTVFVDGNGDAFEFRTLRGSGFGGRLTALLTESFELGGEYSTHKLDIESDDAELKLDFDQYRAGFRAVARPENLEYPLYVAGGLEYARLQSVAEIQFASSVTEAEAGEDPAADADTRANDIPLGKDKENFGIAHVRAGYRSAKTHFYGDLGYGLSDDDSVFEMLGGLSYSYLPNLTLFGEYRSSLFSADAGNKNRFNDLRLGLGFGF